MLTRIGFLQRVLQGETPEAFLQSIMEFCSVPPEDQDRFQRRYLPEAEIAVKKEYSRRGGLNAKGRSGRPKSKTYKFYFDDSEGRSGSRFQGGLADGNQVLDKVREGLIAASASPEGSSGHPGVGRYSTWAARVSRFASW